MFCVTVTRAVGEAGDWRREQESIYLITKSRALSGIVPNHCDSKAKER